MRYIVGIECTAWNFGISVIDSDGHQVKSWSNSYIPEIGQNVDSKACYTSHTTYLQTNFLDLLETDQYNYYFNNVTKLYITNGPGFRGILHLGFLIYLQIKDRFKHIELCMIHHGLAHLSRTAFETNTYKKPLSRESGLLYDKSLILYFSGGHSSWYSLSKNKEALDIVLLAQTGDLAIGNAFDKFARVNNLAHPGGASIEKKAKLIEDNLSNQAREKLLNQVKPLRQIARFIYLSGLLASLNRSKTLSIEEKCYILQDNIFSKITEITHQLLSMGSYNAVYLIGGVANSEALNNKMKKFIENYNDLSQSMNKDSSVEHMINPVMYHRSKPPTNSDSAYNVALAGLLQIPYATLDVEESSLQAYSRFTPDLLLHNCYHQLDYWPTLLGSQSKIKLIDYEGQVAIQKTYFTDLHYPFFSKNTSKKTSSKEYKWLILLKELPVPKVLLRDSSRLIMSYIQPQGAIDLNNKTHIYMILDLIINLHNRNIIHNDLDLNNLILSNNIIHLIDFGRTIMSTKIYDKVRDLFHILEKLKFKKQYLEYYSLKTDINLGDVLKALTNQLKHYY